ncbi:hypothetical protein SDC9_184923 [bioreactor metagenome]|uniref:Uncharacterized protein n=1 Tax=bioreactor metagenome TaxID=1076179 RepID=A0A645HFQ9_9ZZZZ
MKNEKYMEYSHAASGYIFFVICILVASGCSLVIRSLKLCPSLYILIEKRGENHNETREQTFYDYIYRIHCLLCGTHDRVDGMAHRSELFGRGIYPEAGGYRYTDPRYALCWVWLEGYRAFAHRGFTRHNHRSCIGAGCICGGVYH